MPPHPRARAALALLATLVLVACGSSGSSGDSRGANGSSATGSSSGSSRSAARTTPEHKKPLAGKAADGRGQRADADAGGKPKRRRRSSRGSRRLRLPRETQRDITRVRQLVADLVYGLNQRDPSVCTRLFTRHRLEVITGRKGDEAVAKCRHDVAASKTKLTLLKIEGVRLAKAGDEVRLVQFVSRVRGKKVRQLLQLARLRGRYRIDAALPARQAD